MKTKNIGILLLLVYTAVIFTTDLERYLLTHIIVLVIAILLLIFSARETRDRR